MAGQASAIVLEWLDGGPSPFLAVAERQGGQTRPLETVPLTGGDTITITGTDFYDVSAVTIDGVDAASFTAIRSAWKIRVAG